MSMAITILGCGSSGGVPRVGGDWGACDRTNPKNRRRRCSILVERTKGEGRTVALVDTSPDLREQLLAAEVTRLDGILMTHAHADHTHGIDDVRPLVISMRKRIEMFMDDPTAEDLRTKFAYVFETPAGSQYPPLLDVRHLTPGHACAIDGPGGKIEAMPFRLEHGEVDALGFRFGDVAYTPDLNAVPRESWTFLEGLDIWIVDALRYMRHPSHLSLSETLELIRQLKPRRAIVTNLHTDLDFERLRQELPHNVEPAYDGMRIEF
ncbi:MAG: Phosphoribosyl 1,2-cyclic phosphodiesterase [Hyphomicrobiales bacterium]|nr:Phosphoribosyl 1,2-cyclic phosphodiesterase [Hyphomicrobiales bacterium]